MSIMTAMTTSSVAEVVRTFLSQRGVELPDKTCTELVSLVLDTASVPSYVEPEQTAPMPSLVLAEAVALSRTATA